MYKYGILARFLDGKYLRFLFRSSMIVATLAVVMGRNPHFAFSQEEAALEKLKRTAFNFHQVASGIYRSGLISKEAVPAFKELGIKTVITFDNDLKRVEKEKEFLKGSGIELISIPWSGWDNPEDETISKTLSLIESPERKPLLVHCKQGQERTGVVIACWRIAHQDWSIGEAYREMRAHGFRPFQYGHLKKYVYEFARRRGDQSAEINSPAERMKTDILSFFYRLRKLNPFFRSQVTTKI